MGKEGYEYFHEGISSDEIHAIMDREVIITDEYVMNKLSARDAKIFEDHFMSCRRCIEEIGISEEMKKGFSSLTKQEKQELFGKLLKEEED